MAMLGVVRSHVNTYFLIERHFSLTNMASVHTLPRPYAYGYGPWTGPPREMTLGTTPRAR